MGRETREEKKVKSSEKYHNRGGRYLTPKAPYVFFFHTIAIKEEVQSLFEST
jgi:hypothetical protein